MLSYLRLVEFEGVTRPATRISYLRLRDGMLLYHSLAPLNSVLNAVAAMLLLAGFYCIRRKWVRAHRAFMLSAFAVSATFFISYVIYHYHVGDVQFQGQGWVRPVYFTILISHVLLAAAIVPLVLATLWRALNGHFRRHRQIARWAWPIWIYVSVTGVIVYLMCYQLYPPGYSQPISAPGLTAAVRSNGNASPSIDSGRLESRPYKNQQTHTEHRYVSSSRNRPPS